MWANEGQKWHLLFWTEKKKEIHFFLIAQTYLYDIKWMFEGRIKWHSIYFDYIENGWMVYILLTSLAYHHDAIQSELSLDWFAKWKWCDKSHFRNHRNDKLMIQNQYPRNEKGPMGIQNHSRRKFHDSSSFLAWSPQKKGDDDCHF